MTAWHHHGGYALRIPACWTDFMYQGKHFRRFGARFYEVPL